MYCKRVILRDTIVGIDKKDFHKNIEFPKDFIFGTSIAAFQVEGNIDGKRLTDWDHFFHENPNQVIRPGEIGPNWWGDIETLEKDLKMISDLGVKMQRLSIEWGRIEPEQGHIDTTAVKKYREIIDLCLKYGLTPMVTINHFTLPLWVSKSGGWENPKIVGWHLKFAEILLHEFSDISNWIIVNEPNIVLYGGRLLGISPPNKKSIISTLIARKNMIETQKRLYTFIKKQQPDSQVGNAFAFLWLRSNDKNSKIEKLLAKSLNYIINTNFISATKDYMDFIGVNYYSGYYVDLKLNYFSTTMRNEAVYVPHHLPFGKTVRPKTYKSDTGWPIVPDFFLDVLKHLHWAYKKPILITENGIADRDDIYRSFYILTHMVALQKAMEEGIDIRGYIHWATVDNLEWIEGFAKRFGLISVDPVTGVRALRNGAKVFEEIIRGENTQIDHLIEEFVPKEQKEYAYYVINQLLESSDKNCPRIEKV